MPHDHRFHERVLALSPSAIVVVDGDGRITYSNAAMDQLAGWESGSTNGAHIIEFVHPDDIEWVIEAFDDVIEGENNPVPPTDPSPRSWASIAFRLLTRDGDVVPIEVTGTSTLDNPAVAGVIYAVRPIERDAIVDRVVAGVAVGEPLDDLLRLVLDTVTLPPLDIDVALIERHITRPPRLVGASTTDLGRAVADGISDWSDTRVDQDVMRVEVPDLADPLAYRLALMGYRETFVTDVVAPDLESEFRLVACVRRSSNPAHGTIHRLVHARQLIAVGLLRAHHDQLLEHAATHDALTSVPNRLGLTRRFDHLMTTDDGCSLLYLDLDGFKPINDAFGHGVGDQVLSVVAERLRRSVRTRDTVARIGGDEFAILIPGPGRDIQRPRRIAERVVCSLREPIAVSTADGPALVSVTASVGIARSEPTMSLERLMHAADAAMYAAKRSGGDCVKVFDSAAAMVCTV